MHLMSVTVISSQTETGVVRVLGLKLFWKFFFLKKIVGITRTTSSFWSLLQFAERYVAAQNNWKSATKSFERIMLPIEQKVASKLRRLFAGLGDQTYQLLREFQKYKELVKRP